MRKLSKDGLLDLEGPSKSTLNLAFDEGLYADLGPNTGLHGPTAALQLADFCRATLTYSRWVFHRISLQEQPMSKNTSSRAAYWQASCTSCSCIEPVPGASD